MKLHANEKKYILVDEPRFLKCSYISNISFINKDAGHTYFLLQKCKFKYTKTNSKHEKALNKLSLSSVVHSAIQDYEQGSIAV